jgi:hypothetical protein
MSIPPRKDLLVTSHPARLTGSIAPKQMRNLRNVDLRRC